MPRRSSNARCSGLRARAGEHALPREALGLPALELLDLLDLAVDPNSPDRVAVALSVDGLNTIDARHTSAWNASKWVIEPYQTITISGWQVSSERARHFYFTNERDSYGAKLGQTENLGVISAVFFRERNRIITAVPRDVVPSMGREADARAQSEAKSEASKAPLRNDDYAAPGIGRNLHNDVRWVDMNLESQSAGEITIRYEFYPELLRLGVIPRRGSREDSRGFSPEP